MAGSAPTVLERAGSWLGLCAMAAGLGLRRRVLAEWYGTPLHLWGLERPAAQGFAAAPRDPRPVDPERGAALLAGIFDLGGESLRAAGGDPWNQASPSRRFAEQLHRFDWLGELMALGEDGQREALRLTLEWRRVFGRWNAFAWSPSVLERRVLNLACAGRALAALASDAETAALATNLARQARHLLALARQPERQAERLTATAVAGAALAGPAGERLSRDALARLSAALEQTVLADGGHASRSPEAGLELLLDALTLDDGLSQRGLAPPEALSRAIDRLTAGLRFFTLNDGGLAAFHGGGPSAPRRIAAGRAHESALADAGAASGPPPRSASHSGYQRLEGQGLQVIADAGAPAKGPFSLTACGQPLAIEVLCGRERLITNSGWSAEAAAPQSLRLAAGGSTAAIGEGQVGAPVRGFLAWALGPRLDGGARKVLVHRREAEDGVWVEMEHDGWVARYGLRHERRLFLDLAHGELRGEDRFVPAPNASDRVTPVHIHFHLHPDVDASLARDQRSVLIRGPANVGWWLRNDAAEVAIEPSVHYQAGYARGASQVVLRGRLRADRGGRVRWKLALVESANP